MPDLSSGLTASCLSALLLESSVQNPDAIPQYLVFVAVVIGIVIVGREKVVDLRFEDVENRTPIPKDQAVVNFVEWKDVIIAGGME
jgi:hypothetical protein